MIKRREAIVDIVNREGQISLAELKALFPDVSEVTLRKDLQYLDANWQIVRFHGGAKSIYSAFDQIDLYQVRAKKNVSEKQIIAAKAAAMIKPDSSVFIAAGSTCGELAKNLPDVPLHVFTDGLYTAIELANLAKCVPTILGGQIELNSLQVTGPTIFAELENLHFDITFLGVGAYSVERGFSTASQHTHAEHKALLRCSDRVVVLMDHSKAEQPVGPLTIPASCFDTVVSDGQLSEAVRKSFSDAGVTVL